MLFLLMLRRPPSPTLFPYTTLFRSLDILQSVPVLGYISFTVTAFIALFPGKMLGVECAAIFAIFTSQDRKSTRLNSSHVEISYAVFCLKKKKSPIHLPRLGAPRRGS